MTILAAYFDDSRGVRDPNDPSDREGFHAIAGYLGLLEEWDGPFADAWKFMLVNAPHQVCEFKASDCRGGREDFLDVERTQTVRVYDDACKVLRKERRTGVWTKAERDTLYRAAVDVITDKSFSRMFGVGAVMRIPSLGDSALELALEDAALQLCLVEVVSSVLQLASHHFGGEADIHFICDEQAGLEGRLVDNFNIVRDIWKPSYKGHLSKLTFDDSKKIPALQAADLLAYESRKDLLNRTEQPPRRRSRALERLIDERFHMVYYSDPYLYDDRMEQAAFLELLPQIPEDYQIQSFPVLFASPTLQTVMPWETHPSRDAPLFWPWEGR